MTELFADAEKGWLWRLLDKISRGPSAQDRDVLEAMYEKHGGVRVVYPTAAESLAVRSRERRESIERQIRKLQAQLGEPHDSQDEDKKE